MKTGIPCLALSTAFCLAPEIAIAQQSGRVILVERASGSESRTSSSFRTISPVQMTRSTAKRLKTRELAKKLLPRDLAAQAVSHKLGAPLLSGQELTSIEFALRPKPLGVDLCLGERVYIPGKAAPGGITHRMQADPPMIFKEAWASLGLAAAPDCKLRDGLFAQLRSREDVDATASALRRLLSLRREASGRLPLTIDLTCVSNTDEPACKGGSRAALAGLPLHRVHVVERHGSGWRFAVMPGAPGEHYWNVTLSGPASGRQKVDLVWDVPAPF
jgi:hypothetical protein